MNLRFELTEAAKFLLEKRYIHKDLGESNWEDVVNRVLNCIAPGKEERFREMLLERYFVPNSPTLVNAGTNIKSYAACYVIPMEDSLESIYRSKYEFAKICQKGGGCGTTLSHLRPEGYPVAGSTHSKAAGPVKFGNTICHDMNALTQAGFRRMAMMLTMSCKHPDIEKFIRAKTEEGVMSTANISVMATDDFMDAAIGTTHSLYEREFGDYKEKFNASKLLDLIAYQAWLNGEPGIIFEDTVNQNTPYKYSNQYLESTNPCGELPLPFYGVCCLGSIDVSKCWSDGQFDWSHFKQIVSLSVEFLDSILSASEWPLEQVANWVEDNRAIGLGVMGFADLLLKMGIPYGCEKSIQWAEDLTMCMMEQANPTSIQLGTEKGIPKNCKMLPSPSRRNITLLSIAPTGSVAILSGCSHGIEPIYSPTYTRVDEDGDTYEVAHELADESYFRSAINDDSSKVVTWKEHIDVQAAFQKFVDSSISKTINFPNSATVQDVKNAFIYAWQKGCKGLAVYRDGSRQVQILNTKKSLDFESGPVTYEKLERPRVLESKTYKVKGGDSNGNVYITIAEKDETPVEVFYNSVSIDLNDVQMRDGFSRLSSLALRSGVPVEELVKELRQIPAQSLKSVPARIANILEEYVSINSVCPDCGSCLQRVEGCESCAACGYSKCD